MSANLRLLQQSILDTGITSVNFFNGRLLTAEDLSREQQARRDADRRLALAIGDGVAWGLEVGAAADQSQGPVVDIAAGLAINRKGQTLHLARPLSLVLSDRSLPKAVKARTFDDCGLRTATYASRPGLYLLTIAPAEADLGRAPTHALDQGAAQCNTDAVLETVQFRLLRLVPELSAAAQADMDLMRSTVAWQCFDLDAFDEFLIDPLRAPAPRAEPLRALAGKAFTDCDVPLAIVNVTTRVQFVDLWSVRRRPTPRGATAAWGMVAGARRQAEGEAMFLQFQEQLASLTRSAGDVRGIAAGDKFDLLPAAGVLPVPADGTEEAAAMATFFAGTATRGLAFVEGARLESLLRASFAFPPVDPRSNELIWLYRVRENRHELDRRQAPLPQACVVYTTGHMPYQADARVNLAKWNYGNYPIDFV